MSVSYPRCPIYRRSCYRVRWPPCIQSWLFFCYLQHKYLRADLTSEFKLNSSPSRHIIPDVKCCLGERGGWQGNGFPLPWVCDWLCRSHVGGPQEELLEQRKAGQWWSVLEWQNLTPFFPVNLLKCLLVIFKSYTRSVFMGKCSKIFGKKAPVSEGSNATQQQALGNRGQWEDIFLSEQMKIFLCCLPSAGLQLESLR